MYDLPIEMPDDLPDAGYPANADSLSTKWKPRASNQQKLNIANVFYCLHTYIPIEMPDDLPDADHQASADPSCTNFKPRASNQQQLSKASDLPIEIPQDCPANADQFSKNIIPLTPIQLQLDIASALPIEMPDDEPNSGHPACADSLKINFKPWASNQQQRNIASALPREMPEDCPSSPLPSNADPSCNNVKPPTSRQPSSSPYKIESSRGIVVIFNYYFEGQGKYQRVGAAADYQNLEKVFKEMNYEVLPENIDLTKKKTLKKLDEIRSLPRLETVDSFIAFFLSHEGDSPDSFRTVESELISVEEIIFSKFTDADCPLLRRKPKLFFFNFCRGTTVQLQSDTWTLDTKYAEAPKDVAVIHAALPQFAAMRDITKGTAFINCLCKVLNKYAESNDLQEIMYMTSSFMQKQQATTPIVNFIAFGRFYFR